MKDLIQDANFAEKVRKTVKLQWTREDWYAVFAVARGQALP